MFNHLQHLPPEQKCEQFVYFSSFSLSLSHFNGSFQSAKKICECKYFILCVRGHSCPLYKKQVSFFLFFFSMHVFYINTNMYVLRTRFLFYLFDFQLCFFLSQKCFLLISSTFLFIVVMRVYASEPKKEEEMIFFCEISRLWGKK